MRGDGGHAAPIVPPLGALVGVLNVVTVIGPINVALHELSPSRVRALPAEAQAEIAAELNDEQPGVPASPD
jgi:hypothetical protein